MLIHEQLDVDLALPNATKAEAAAFAALKQKLELTPYYPRVAFTPRSEDLTLGPIPTSRTFYLPRFNLVQMLNDQCEAAPGPLSRRLALARLARLPSGDPGLSWTAFCDQIAQLAPGQLWRHNVEGELPGDLLYFELEAAPLEQLVQANRGRQGFTFTHFQPKVGHNAELIAAANERGFTLNLIADSFKEADEFLGWQVAPVVVKVPEDTPDRLRTPAGHLVERCPQNIRRGVSCATCQRCAHPDRDRSIIAFPIPGLRAADIPPDILADMM